VQTPPPQGAATFGFRPRNQAEFRGQHLKATPVGAGQARGDGGQDVNLQPPGQRRQPAVIRIASVLIQDQLQRVPPLGYARRVPAGCGA